VLSCTCVMSCADDVTAACLPFGKRLPFVSQDPDRYLRPVLLSRASLRALPPLCPLCDLYCCRNMHQIIWCDLDPVL
jgi:hypothetical protein